MRKLWLVLGMCLGALIVWALTHEDRRIAADKRAYDRSAEGFTKESTLELGTLGAVHGTDYLSEDYWRQELSQYDDDDDLSAEGVS